MSFWCETTQRSRKSRRCDECGKAIGVGETYTRGVGINVDGDFGIWVTHADCLAATLNQRDLAGLSLDDGWEPLSHWIWDMPHEALVIFARDYPAAYERVAADLAAHGRLTPQ